LKQSTEVFLPELMAARRSISAAEEEGRKYVRAG
jgi:hypothetical protein